MRKTAISIHTVIIFRREFVRSASEAQHFNVSSCFSVVARRTGNRTTPEIYEQLQNRNWVRARSFVKAAQKGKDGGLSRCTTDYQTQLRRSNYTVLTIERNKKKNNADLYQRKNYRKSRIYTNKAGNSFATCSIFQLNLPFLPLNLFATSTKDISGNWLPRKLAPRAKLVAMVTRPATEMKEICKNKYWPTAATGKNKLLRKNFYQKKK
jgi:hypothetical protein